MKLLFLWLTRITFEEIFGFFDLEIGGFEPLIADENFRALFRLPLICHDTNLKENVKKWTAKCEMYKI